MIAGTGDWGRRESNFLAILWVFYPPTHPFSSLVTMEIELSPLPDGAPYVLVVSARIGNVKFEEVPYCIIIHRLVLANSGKTTTLTHNSAQPLKAAVPLTTSVPDLIKMMLLWLRLNYDNQRVQIQSLQIGNQYLPK